MKITVFCRDCKKKFETEAKEIRIMGLSQKIAKDTKCEDCRKNKAPQSLISN